MEAWKVALDQVLKSWERTPYVLGSICKRRGVDCVRFASGVMDQLHGMKIENPDAFVVGDHRVATRRVAELVARYPHRVIRDGSIEAGDTLIVRSGNLAGHVMLVGSDGKTLWHATQGSGVCTTSLEAYRSRVMRVYRSTNRESWNFNRS